MLLAYQKTLITHHASTLIALSLVCTMLTCKAPNIRAAQVSDERTVQRYLQLLERRPASGTAFDRVYNYYQSNDRVPGLIESLQRTNASPDIQAARQLLLGMVYLKEGQSDAAIQQFKLAQQHRPDDSTLEQLLADALIAKADYSSAAKALESAFQKSTSRTTALSFVKQMTMVYDKLNQPEDSLRVLKAFDEAYPGDPTIQQRLTTSLIALGKADEALQIIDAQLKKTASNSDKLALQIQRSELLLQAGRNEAAVTSFQSVLEQLRPGSWQATEIETKLRNAFLSQGQSEEWADYLRRRVEQNPSEIAIRTQLIRFLSEQNQHVQAIEVFADANQNSSAPELRRAIVNSLATQNEFKEVDAIFTEFREQQILTEGDILQWANLSLAADSSTDDSQITRVEDIYRSLLTLREDSQMQWQRHLQIAELLLQAGIHQQAEVHFQKASESRNAGPSAFIRFAEFLFRRQQDDQAVELLTNKAHAGPASKDFLRQAADLLAKSDRAQEALKLFSRHMPEQPQPEDQLLLARLFILNDQPQTALNQLATLLLESPVEIQKTVREKIVDMLLETDSAATAFEVLQANNSLRDQELMLLASLAEAQGRLSVALQVLRQVDGVATVQIEALEMTARLQQKAGQLEAATESLAELARLAPRQAATYQESIQNLQLQLGRQSDAQETARRLYLDSATSPASVRRYVTFLQNSDRPLEAVKVLTEYLETAPNQTSLMIVLADLLADQYRSDDATTWLWKAFSSTDQEMLQRDIARRLVMLSLRSNRSESVLQQLKAQLLQTSARKQHHALLMADAYRQTRQLEEAIRELENYSQAHPVDAIVLEELTDLYAESKQVTRAIRCQIRLSLIKPENSVFGRLVQLIESNPDLSFLTSHQKDLDRLSQLPNWTDFGLAIADHGIAQNQNQASLIILQTLKPDPEAEWKVVLRGTQASRETNDSENWNKRAQSITERPVSLNDLVSFATESHETDSVLSRYMAARWTMMLLCSNQSPEELHFQITRLIGNPQELKDLSHSKILLFAEQSLHLFHEQAIEAKDLFEAAQHVADGQSAEHKAAALALMAASRGRAVDAENDSRSEFLWDSDSASMVIALVAELRNDLSVALPLNLLYQIHDGLMESGHHRAALSFCRQQLLATNQQQPDRLNDLWSGAVRSRNLPLAQTVIKQWHSAAQKEDRLLATLPPDAGRAFALFASLCTPEERQQLLLDFLTLKAANLTSIQANDDLSRPSFEVSWTQKTSHRLFENGRHIGSRNVVTLPGNAYASQTDITFFVNLLHGLSQQDQVQLVTQATTLTQAANPIAVQAVGHIATAHLLCLQSKFEQAMLHVIDAARLRPEDGTLRVLVAAFHAENGHALAALNVLRTVVETDVKAYQQSLWLALKIGMSSGQIDVSRQAANSLLGIRLTEQEKSHLAMVIKRKGLNVELPISDESKSEQQRPMEGLVQQMQHRQQSGQMDRAIEIANSILLASDEDRFATRMTSAARQEAIRILTINNQLSGSLDQVDRRLQLNPNSEQLLKLKREMLLALKRTSEADEIANRLAAMAPETPEAWMQRASRFEDERQFDQAANAYLKAFHARPSLLLNDYYRYFKVFRRIDRLPDLAELLMQADLRQLRDNYFVFSELIDLLLAQPDQTENGRRSIQTGFNLLQEAWQAFPSDRNYLLNNIQAKRLWESDFIIQFVSDSLIPTSAQQAFARPWLGLDSGTVTIDEKRQLSPFQRVLSHLKDGPARKQFVQQIATAQSQYPEWLAGPFLKAAVDESRKDLQRLETFLKDANQLAIDQPLPLPVAMNVVSIFKRASKKTDRSLADMLSASLTAHQKSLPDDAQTELRKLLAELYLNSGDTYLGRCQIIDAVDQLQQRFQRTNDPEAAWNYLLNVIEAVRLLEARQLRLDTLAMSRRLSPELLSISREFQSAGAIDLQCQRLWQQAKRIPQQATEQDLIQYLSSQIKDVEKGRRFEWDLMLNKPKWGDRIAWSNSDVLTIVRRCGQSTHTSPALATLLKPIDRLDVSRDLCWLALQSQRMESSAYRMAVESFLKKYDSTSDLPASRNTILIWVLAEPLHSQPTQPLDRELARQLMQVAMSSSRETATQNVWHQCIRAEAGSTLLLEQKVDEAAGNLAGALDALLPPLQLKSSAERSPLKETRRKLLQR